MSGFTKFVLWLVAIQVLAIGAVVLATVYPLGLLGIGILALCVGNEALKVHPCGHDWIDGDVCWKCKQPKRILYVRN